VVLWSDKGSERHEKDVTDIPQAREIAYRCVVGHEIATRDLDRETIVTSLDGGALIRICREHGAPTALRSRPVDNSDGSRADLSRS
jgi:hypothetical protein